MSTVLKSGSLNLLEASGTPPVCNGIALRLTVLPTSDDDFNVVATHLNKMKRKKFRSMQGYGSLHEFNIFLITAAPLLELGQRSCYIVQGPASNLITGRVDRCPRLFSPLSSVYGNNASVILCVYLLSGSKLWRSRLRHCSKRRSRIRFPMVSLEIFIHVNLPAALWTECRLRLYFSMEQSPS